MENIVRKTLALRIQELETIGQVLLEENNKLKSDCEVLVKDRQELTNQVEQLKQQLNNNNSPKCKKG